MPEGDTDWGAELLGVHNWAVWPLPGLAPGKWEQSVRTAVPAPDSVRLAWLLCLCQGIENQLDGSTGSSICGESSGGRTTFSGWSVISVEGKRVAGLGDEDLAPTLEVGASRSRRPPLVSQRGPLVDNFLPPSPLSNEHDAAPDLGRFWLTRSIPPALPASDTFASLNRAPSTTDWKSETVPTVGSLGVATRPSWSRRESIWNFNNDDKGITVASGARTCPSWRAANLCCRACCNMRKRFSMVSDLCARDDS
mmetsp:Transcript_14755/g.32761  ORF Transcript_14755/g.32761 Transcript_14755/m.32761 type:complete len:252 (-) Transcript_14755:103-858(-)